MAKNTKNFVVSTADFVMKYNGAVACTGTTNLNTTIEVSMQEQNVNAGKGNKLVYSFKYGRELSVNLETANWDLRYLAANLGKDINIDLSDCYKINECITINGGIGTLPVAPIGNVAVELGDTFVEIVPTGSTIDMTSHGITSGTVNVTYKYQAISKNIIIDADTAPRVYELILDAEKHNNKLGKVGTIQIEIPSYQPSGNFSINFTPDGTVSTNIDGKALAVEGDTCESGSAVYAYVREFDDNASAIVVTDIVATPSAVALKEGESVDISVIGLRGAMNSTVQIENEKCTFATSSASAVTVVDGKITAHAEGTAYITVTYEGKKDIIEVTVTA